MTLKEVRKRSQLTQAQASALLGVSLRSYKDYENDPEKAGTLKYKMMKDKLEESSRIDETHGVLTLPEIRRICHEQLSRYPVTYGYLFGSYAKGTANASSDVDLLISGEVDGLRFYGLVDTLREALNKKVDVLTPSQLTKNQQLLDEILRDGVKIYG